jgi:chemotaxis protein histidine kinase CheA
MTTLSQYFEAEAHDSLSQLQHELQESVPDIERMHRAARTLRGTAQLAREQDIASAAAALEAGLRAAARGSGWSDDLARRVRDTVDDLQALIGRDEDGDAAGEHVRRAKERWNDGGQAAAAASYSAASASGLTEFRQFVAREADAVAGALDVALKELAAAPMDREPLKHVLRRQAALLGSARLDEVPVVAEILRALEDLTRVVAKLDVGVKQEWLDIYRIARDGLRSAVDQLARDADPAPSNAVSRLRHIRHELIERYGSGENAEFASPAPAEEPVLELAADTIVEDEGVELPVEALLYDRETALRRALELNDVIVRATAADPQARDAAEELFDLIRLALE